MYILIGIVAVIALWSLFGFLTSNVEHASYTVVEARSGYEIRKYDAHIEAQTTVSGPYKQALNEGFRIVAGYIFGGNTKKESIAMTAPVVEQKAGNEKIAMTAPVTATLAGESHTIAFGMPRSYTLESLPTPNDSRVSLVEVPERKVAVMRFSWLRTDNRVEAKKEELLQALKRDGISAVGEVQYAGYNAPWTPPWMTRNEVLVQID